MRKILLLLFLFPISVANAATVPDTVKLSFTSRVDAGKFKFNYNAKFNLKFLDVEGGLTSSYINSIAEDKNGNIWMGTWGGGVMKFDGRNIFKINTNSGLISNIADVCSDNNQEIWMLVDGKIFYYDGKNLINRSSHSKLDDHYASRFFAFQKNSMLVLTEDSMAFEITDKKVEDIRPKYGIKEERFYAVENFNGKSYLCGKNGIYIIQNDKVIDHICSGRKVYGISLLSEENKVILFKDKIAHIIKQDTTNILPDVSPKSVVELRCDKLGNYWVAYGQGVVKYNTKETIYFKDNNGLTTGFIWALFIDSRNNVWIGTRAGGVCRYDNALFRHYDRSDSIPNHSVWAITEDKKNNIKYLGILRGGVCMLKQGKIEKMPIPADFTKTSVRSLHYDRNGNLWLGSTNGLFHFKSGKLSDCSTKSQNLEELVFRIKEDKNGVVWFLSHKGISCYKNDTFYLPFKTDTLNDIDAMDICWDSKGNTWFATSGRGILVFDKNEKQILPELAEPTKDGIVFNVMEDYKGRIWAGTRAGIYVYDAGQLVHITEKEGLSNDIVWSIGEDARKTIWAGTEFGLSKITYNNSKDFRIEAFGIQEGFTGNDCTQNGLLIDHKGDFYWGTSKKLTIINPELSYDKGLQPHVTITGLTLHYKPVELVDGYNVMSDTTLLKNLHYTNNYITFNFVGIDWGAEDRLVYQYKLEGFSNEWCPLSNKTSATFSNLNPGEYTFFVRALSNKGLMSKETKVSFYIEPAFWQTMWFKIVVVLMLLISVYLFFQYKLSNIRKQRKVLEQKVKERTLELHEKNEELNQQNEEILAQSEEIEHQRNVLEEKQKEILDSITYAHRLQEAILPAKSYVDAHFPDNFVLYKPKDIIAGDFYWMEHMEFEMAKQTPYGEVNAITFVAAADSTGHGVPGAIVSVVCSNALNRAAFEFGLIDPGQLLNKTRELVIETFSRSDKEVKDGMDISLAAVYHIKNAKGVNVLWAGANNPLWYVSNRIMNEIKANKQPIGKYAAEKPFTTHHLSLQKGDILYLFTDGYPDQFGGESRKKMMYRPFRELLFTCSKHPMQEQYTMLDQSFDEWKGEFKQIDDVCVLGIKL